MSQILAIASLHFKTLLRRAHGATRAVSVVVAVLMGGLGLLLSLLIAAAVGVMLWSSVHQPDMTRVIHVGAFYTFFVFGVIFPVLRGAIEQGLDLRRLRGFPIAPGRLFRITLVSTLGSVDHVVYYPALLTLVAATVAFTKTGLLAATVVSALMLGFYVCWGYAINLALAEITRTRRLREVIAILTFLLLIGVSFTPMLLEEDGSGIRDVPFLSSLARGAKAVSIVLPPNLAGDALMAAHHGQTAAAGWRLAAIAIWVVSGLALGYAVFIRYHLADRSESTTRGKPVPRSEDRRMPGIFSFDNRLLEPIPVEVRAVAAKELRYLLRSVNGRFILLVMPFMVIVVASVFSEAFDEPVMGIDPTRVSLFGLFLYSVFMSNSFINNAFAWEGDGIKAYFMSPVSLEQVILGKNLGVWLYNAVILGIVVVCWVGTMGFTGLEPLVSSVLLFLITLVVLTAMGNVVSVLFPVGRNISSMMNSPSQTGFLLSVGTLGVAVSLASVGVMASLLLGVENLLPLFLLAILAMAVGFYILGLRASAALMGRRKDRLIRTLRVKA